MACPQEIGDTVKKCKVLLLDIEGTTTSISFVKDKLFPYAEANVRDYLTAEWESDDVKTVVTALRKLALEDKEKSIDGVVAIPGEDASKEDQIEGLVNNVKWQMSSDRKVGPLKEIQGLIWKKGYDSGDIKGHVFDDVSPALEAWRATEGHKIYIYSSGSVQAQKLLFGQSLSGDLLKYIDGHFDTAVGAKQEAESYKKIAEQIGCKPDEILFLSDIVKEAEAAVSAGMNAALVSRAGNAALSDDDTKTFPVLESFTQLTQTNKRKTSEDGDQEAQPSKIAKTATEKVASESCVEETPLVKDTEAEQMEVDSAIRDETEKSPIQEEVIIKEVVEPTADDLQVDMEPDIVEIPEGEAKTESKDIETETKVETVPEEAKSKNSEEKTEKLAEAAKEDDDFVTEIEDITDVPIIDEVIEENIDVEPIVEEPMEATDDTVMTELQNAGTELEKECDEILSKVNSVTNLDNISVKPLLKTIPEDVGSVEESPEAELLPDLKEKTDKSEEVSESIEDITEEITKMQNEIIDDEIEKEKDVKADEKAQEKMEEDLKEHAQEKIEEDLKETAQETMEEDVKENVIEKNEESLKETTEESPKDKTDEIPKLKTDESPKEKVQSSPKVKTEEKLKEKTDESPKEKKNESLKEKKNESPKEKIDEIPKEKIDESPKENADESSKENTDAKAEESKREEVTPSENDNEKIHLNGKAEANGVKLNGNSKVESNGKSNGDERLNGSGDGEMEKEEVRGSESMEKEVSEIKVKSVPSEETPPEATGVEEVKA